MADQMAELRRQCLARGACGITGLGRLFRIMDDNGGKSLCLEEFKEGIHDCGIVMEAADVELQSVQSQATLSFS